MSHRPSRLLTWCLASCVSFAGLVSTANAGVIGAAAVAEAAAAESGAQGQLSRLLDRADVVTALAERGVDPAQVRARVASLTDAEAAQLLRQIDEAPAGASDVLGVIVFIFVLLLVTDVLGFTKVFPFTRSIR